MQGLLSCQKSCWHADSNSRRLSQLLLTSFVYGCIYSALHATTRPGRRLYLQQRSAEVPQDLHAGVHQQLRFRHRWGARQKCDPGYDAVQWRRRVYGGLICVDRGRYLERRHAAVRIHDGRDALEEGPGEIERRGAK